MKQATPYSSLTTAERGRELVCMRTIFADAAPPKLVYEAFGGIGMTAELMCQLWPKAKVRSWELDETCVEAYEARALPRAQIKHGDTRFAPATLKFDAASLDFNQFTILDLTRPAGLFQRQLIKAVARHSPKWIQLTDSAISHLHLNFGRYGLAASDWAQYVAALDRELQRDFQYGIVASARHRRASYFRLEPV